MSYGNNNIYMNYRSGSLNLNSSWAGKSLLEALSKLPDISVNDEMKFQQKQQQERETKKDEMVGTINQDVGDGKILGSSMGAGKVRQMFNQRRHRVEGIDKSYPLQPILPRSSPSTTTTTTTKKTVTNVRKTVGAVRTTNGNVKSNVLTQKRISPNFKTNELNGNSRLNGTTNLSNKLTVDDVDSYEDFLEDEKFPEFGISLEDDFLNNSITQKLPNVGKLAALSLNNNNNNINNNSNEMESNINNNNNTVKLKPVVTKKILRDEPVKPLNGRRKIVPLSRSREESKSASEGNGAITPKAVKSRTPTSTAKSTPITSTKTTPVKQRTTTPPPNSAPCKMCGRYFNEDRIAKHETICVKTTTKKRKVFDVTKQRVQGTEAEVYVKKATKSSGSKAGATKQPEVAKKSDWRRKHEEFIAAIRAAKEVKAHLAKGGKLSDLPPPPPSENPDYVQCPHCSRRFNETAAARHIPKCKDMQHNKPKAPVKKRF